MASPLYIFIDESGNFDFSKKGTKFYTFTALMTSEPTRYVDLIKNTQFDLLGGRLCPGLDQIYLDQKLCKHFHASEDKQAVRDVFFDIINRMDSIKVISIVVRKNRTNPSLHEPPKVYSSFLKYLMRYVVRACVFSDLMIFIDGYAASNKKGIFKQAIVSEISAITPKIKYRIYHPDSASFCHLQVVDYINWAIYKKWESNDLRSYELIKDKLKSPELDIFVRGNTEYY
jgi:hypothetical protein